MHGDLPYELVTSLKFLALVFDETCGFTQQVSAVLERANVRRGVMARLALEVGVLRTGGGGVAGAWRWACCVLRI